MACLVRKLVNSVRSWTTGSGGRGCFYLLPGVPSLDLTEASGHFLNAFIRHVSRSVTYTEVNVVLCRSKSIFSPVIHSMARDVINLRSVIVVVSPHGLKVHGMNRWISSEAGVRARQDEEGKVNETNKHTPQKGCAQSH